MASFSFPFVLSFICASTVFLVWASPSVNIALHIEPSPAVQYVVQGKQLSLNCTTNSTNVTLSWTVYSGHNTGNKASISQHNLSSIQLKINNISYEDSGVYRCTAKNGTNHTVQAEKSVEIKVGDLPPEPSFPVLYDVCGYPPHKASMSYTVPASSTSSNSYTIQLLLSTYTNYGCGDSLDPSFKVFDERSGIFPSSNKRTFNTDISTYLKAVFPDFQCNRSVIYDCSILCATVIVSNVFGKTFSAMPDYWPLKDEARCGNVDELVVLDTTANSVVVGWNKPKCSENTTKRQIYFWLRCEPKCGENIQMKKNVKTYPQSWNYTIESLDPNHPYKIFVSCSFQRNKPSDDQAKPAFVIARTKEGVPTVVPHIIYIQWNVSTVLHGTAVVEWNAITDERKLKGKLRSYNLTYQRLNDLKSKPVEIAVGADVHRLVIEGLPMGNYTFTIKACTGGGCGDDSGPTLLSSLVATKPGNPTVSTEPANDQMMVTITGALAGSICFVVLLLVVMYFTCYRSRNTGTYRPALSELVIKTTTTDNDSRTSIESNNLYATANYGLSGSEIHVSFQSLSKQDQLSMSTTSSSSGASSGVLY